jgi:hypothetical protein
VPHLAKIRCGSPCRRALLAVDSKDRGATARRGQHRHHHWPCKDPYRVFALISALCKSSQRGESIIRSPVGSSLVASPLRSDGHRRA